MFVHCAERFSDFGKASLLRALQGLRADIFQLMMHGGIDQGAELIRVFFLFQQLTPCVSQSEKTRISRRMTCLIRQRLQHDDALCFLFAREEESVRTGICAFQHVSFHISWKDHVRRMRAFDDAADLGWHGVQRHLAEPDERHLRQLGSDLDEVKDPFALKWQVDTDDALSALQMEMARGMRRSFAHPASVQGLPRC